MLLEDAIAQSVSAYPSLYVADTIELTRLFVLNHFFLVNGNGMEWAYTKKPKDGGYLTHPQYRKFKGDWVRKFDLKYGKPSYTGEPLSRFVEEPYVRISPPSKNFSYMSWGDLDAVSWKGFITEIPEIYKGKMIFQGYSRLDKESPDLPLFGKFGIEMNYSDFTHVISVERSGGKTFKPYPLYDKGWPFASINANDIKPDWREGMIYVYQKALDYETNARVEEDPSYSRDTSWKTTLLKYKDNIPKFILDYAFTEFSYIHITDDNIEEAAIAFRDMQFRKHTDERIVSLTNALECLRAV